MVCWLPTVWVVFCCFEFSSTMGFSCFWNDGITISRDFLKVTFPGFLELRPPMFLIWTNYTQVNLDPEFWASSGGFQGFPKVPIQWESPKKSPGGEMTAGPYLNKKLMLKMHFQFTRTSTETRMQQSACPFSDIIHKVGASRSLNIPKVVLSCWP